MHKLDKSCRILLVIHAVVALLGYVSFLQTDYQLVSPLIPASTLFQVAKHAIYASLPAAVLLIFSLGFYFYQKRIMVIIISCAAILSYYIFSNYILL